jgi:flavodoxin
MKRIVVYYSFTRNNEMLANELQKRLHCDILKIETTGRRTGFSIFLDIAFRRTPRLKDHKVYLGDYNEFIFVAPVWAGKIAAPLRAFLFKEHQYIEDYSFMSFCGGGDEGQADKVANELAAILHHGPKAVKELWINDLLTEEKRKIAKYTTGYRAVPEDLELFREKISEFVTNVAAVNA